MSRSRTAAATASAGPTLPHVAAVDGGCGKIFAPNRNHPRYASRLQNRRRLHRPILKRASATQQFTLSMVPVHRRVTSDPYLALHQPFGPAQNEVIPMQEFGRLVEAQIPRLRRYARALTRDVTRADDLVQSCLTRAVAKQHLWQPGTDLRAWLFTILHNQHVNEVRRSVREGVSVAVEDMAPVLTVQSNAYA